jgi:hypothetical protein
VFYRNQIVGPCHPGPQLEAIKLPDSFDGGSNDAMAMSVATIFTCGRRNNGCGSNSDDFVTGETGSVPRFDWIVDDQGT